MVGVCATSFHCWGSPSRVLDFYERLSSNSSPGMGPRLQILSVLVLETQPQADQACTYPCSQSTRLSLNGLALLHFWCMRISLSACIFKFLVYFVHIFYILKTGRFSMLRSVSYFAMKSLFLSLLSISLSRSSPDNYSLADRWFLKLSSIQLNLVVI